jgi:ABC-type molybdate transport system substrate-binding protein
VTDVGGPGPEDQQGPPRRRIGPYEQSLIESRKREEQADRENAARRRRNRVLGAVLAVVVLAGAGVGVYTFLTKRDVATTVPGSAAQPTSCSDAPTVRVAVAPAAAPAVAAAAEKLSTHDDGPCAAYTVEPAEPFAVAGSLVGAGRPDAWITDSTEWLSRAEAVSGVKAATGKPFATSALVVAMPDAAASALDGQVGWAGVLGGSIPVRVPDPSRSTIGRLALGAAAAVLSEAQLKTAVSNAAKSGKGSVSLDGLATSNPPVGAVVTEAQLVTYNAAHPDAPLTAVAPSEGAGPTEYSLVTLSDDPKVAPLVAALDDYLHGEEAQTLLRDNGFRTQGGNPKDPSDLIGTITVAAPPADAAVAKTVSLWNAAAPKNQALLAVDVSGVMLDLDSGQTRLSSVQRGTVRATAAAAPTTYASLWIYSQHIGDNADDFKALVGYGSLGESKRLQAFDKSVSGLDKFVGGGRGLYDAIAAVYDQAKRNWRAGYSNSAVVVTGGPNDDDYGRSLDALEKDLSAAKDAKRPVRLVIIDIGGRAGADMKKIVAITGGQYVATDSAEDLEPALTAALGG